MVDDLPSASVYRNPKKQTSNADPSQPDIIYDKGIPLARPVLKPGPDKKELTLMNHLLLTIDTHTAE